MSAGTITLTNDSDVVSGVGTTFTIDLKSGDMVVAVVGGVTYTLPVKSIESDTELTLIKPYDGPTQLDSAWAAIPRDTMNAITAQLAAETAKALRGLNYDKNNWQQVFSGSGNITVTLPDGSVFSGPAWNGISGLIAGKQDKLNISEIGNSLISASDAGAVRGVISAADDTKVLKIESNLSEISSVNAKSAARKNIGLGSSAVKDVGTNTGDVIEVGVFGLGARAPEKSAMSDRNVTGAFLERNGHGNLYPASVVGFRVAGPTDKEWGQIAFDFAGAGKYMLQLQHGTRRKQEISLSVGC
ncbi:hypothetical protein [Pragia fontium]|uniref:hypothetical protein n=1 Tax=Pragia fontium TaxID=82985 RepID=UPI0006995A92|nr:hypothetical protein [Pragia fontium]